MKRSTRLQRPGLLGGSTATTLLDADGPQPSLNLDLASGILDPRITFTRSTVGTYYRGQFNQNLVIRSEELDNTTTWPPVPNGTGVNPVRVANNAIAPNGTLTAETITFNTGAGTTGSDQSVIRQNSLATDAGQTYIVSFWARGTVGGERLMVGLSSAYGSFTLTTQWQRVSFVRNNCPSPMNVDIGLRQSIFGTINSNITVELWGVQVTQGDALTPYIPTTTATITQGQIASAAIDVPRFENDPITGASLGLLIEGGITNLCIRSEEFDTWAKVAAGDIVTANAGTAPDGLVTADKIIADTTSGAHGVVRSVTTTGSTTYTQSVFVKAAGWNWVYMTEGNTLTATAWFNLANGTVGTVSGTGTPSAKIQHIGNGWYRCTLTFTTNAGQVNANIQVRPTTGDNVFNGYVGNGVDGVLAWGAQMEAQAFASSYILTTTATVARGDDSAVMTGTNFSNWFNQNEGTFFTDHVQGLAAGTSVGRFVGTANANNSGSTYIDLLRYDFGGIGNARAVVAIGGATQSAMSSAVTGSTIKKSAHAYSVGNAGLSCNAETVVTGAPAALPSVNQLRIGASTATTLFLNGNIRQISYWPTRLPNATLQSLTA